MNVKPPPDRRQFASEWDEIGYLYDKLLYWLYQRENCGKARPYAERLAALLPRVTPHHDAIFGEECWSLVHETRGNLDKAIEHRKNEIRLIRRLHEIASRAPHRAAIMRDYSFEDLSDRLDLLATLYHDSGNLDTAVATLRTSKRLCETHAIRFDEAEMLQEYLAERQAMRNGVTRVSIRKTPLAEIEPHF